MIMMIWPRLNWLRIMSTDGLCVEGDQILSSSRPKCVVYIEIQNVTFSV
jgi:hypothetical protein